MVRLRDQFQLRIRTRGLARPVELQRVITRLVPTQARRLRGGNGFAWGGVRALPRGILSTGDWCPHPSSMSVLCVRQVCVCPWEYGMHGLSRRIVSAKHRAERVHGVRTWIVSSRTWCVCVRAVPGWFFPGTLGRDHLFAMPGRDLPERVGGHKLRAVRQSDRIQQSRGYSLLPVRPDPCPPQRMHPQAHAGQHVGRLLDQRDWR